MKFEEYLDSLRNKSVAVIGIGVSNRPLIRLLLERGIRVTACDKKSREALGPLGDELEQHGCRLQLGEDYLKDLTEDVIFRTPGLRPDVPELAAAVARGSLLTSEMEVFFEVCPCPEIAVTGSDGKTTTTTIIAKLLEAAGRTVHLGGQHRPPAAVRHAGHRANGSGGAGAQLLPADDHGPEPPHRRYDQPVSQPPGRPQELRRVYRCQGKYLYTPDSPGYCRL